MDASKITESSMPTEPGTYVLIPGDYAINIDKAGDTLILVVGFKPNHAGARVQSDRIARTFDTTFHFKHSTNNGGKYWTESGGVEHYVIVPRSTVHLYRENGCSYPTLIVNGVEVVCNTSGGGGSIWTDFIYADGTEACINMPVSDFKKVLEVAVRDTDLEHVIDMSVAKRRVYHTKGEYDDIRLVQGLIDSPKIADFVLSLTQDALEIWVSETARRERAGVFAKNAAQADYTPPVQTTTPVLPGFEAAYRPAWHKVGGSADLGGLPMFNQKEG